MKTKKKKRRVAVARAVQARPAKKNLFPTDAESIELRREGAEMQAAHVVRLELGRSVYGAYQVDSTQWSEPYRVEIRSLAEPFNTCSCRDHAMNRLGTCKHVERVLQFIRRNTKKRDIEEAQRAGGRGYELFMDTRTYPPRLTLLRPATRHDRIEREVGVFFGEDGQALGAPLETFRAIEHAWKGLTSAMRAKMFVSKHIQPWVEPLVREEELARLKESYLSDVQAGKRTSNPVKLPLYPYQREGMLHLAFKGRAMLADEMGLGKTVQAIAAAELLRQIGQVSRVLVVCPASLKSEWEEQFHFFTGQRARTLFGARAGRLQVYAEQPPFLIVNYEQARSDVDDINRLFAPDLTILDEAQRIKNWPTKTAKTIKRLSSPFAFVLTGTPLENRIEELYSLAEFVNPHIFGSLFRFQREFMQATEEGVVQPRNLDELHRRISSVMLRRRKLDVENDLPERTDKHYFVPMTDEQNKRYRDYEYQVTILLNIMKKRPLKKAEMDRLQILLGCMRMTCDTPYILDPECRQCPKLEEMESILDELLADPDVKVIVFSEWVRMLSLVQEVLDEKGYGYALHVGSVPQKKRREEINRFKQDPACRLFLSSESGGAGLNLQVASVVINLDLPWNPAKLEQRIARAWRKNQPRSVRVINLVTENSIEHSMLSRLAHKQALADSVLDGIEAAAPGKHQTFAERLASLMGEEEGLPVTRGTGRGGKTPAAVSGASATRDYLLARYSDRVLSIGKAQASETLLVVARAEEDARRIREDMASAGASQTPLEVLDAATAELLQRLNEQGLIQISPQIESLFAAPGYKPPERPARHLEQARKRWTDSARAWKAAQALLAADLDEMALPHLVACSQTALAALHMLETGEDIDVSKEALDTSRLGPRAGLARSLATWLDQSGNQPPPPCDVAADMIRTFEAQLANS